MKTTAPRFLQITVIVVFLGLCTWLGTLHAEVVRPQPGTDSPVRELLDGFSRYAQSDRLDLYFREDTMEIAIRDKSAGRIWFSNPPNRAEDPLANELNKSHMSSQLKVTVFTPRDQRLVFDSFSEAIKKRRASFKRIPFGVRVTYQLTNEERGEDDIPVAVKKGRFEERFLGRMTEEEREEFLDRYTLNEDEGVYVRRRIPQFKVNEFLAILDRIGYTQEELERDQAEVGEAYTQTREDAAQDRVPGLRLGVGSRDAVVEVTVSIEYLLDGDDFVVRVPVDRIQYDKNYPIASIEVLEYFGAAGPEQQGYMLVPDGSGALIHLNNGKSNYFPYSQGVYGDTEMEIQSERVKESRTAHLPVFGLKSGDDAFLGIIESGDAVATINADVAGRVSSYNRVSPAFELMERGRVTIGSGPQSSSKLLFEDTLASEDMQVRYRFLSGTKATYLGMANAYRWYLQENGTLPSSEELLRPRFHLQLIGAIDVARSFAGISFRQIRPLTTIDQAYRIVDELRGSGLDCVTLRYSGWLENGLRHTFPKNLEPESRVGRPSDFRQFAEQMGSIGVPVVGDVHIPEVYTSGNGFSPGRDASRYLSQAIARSYEYNIATFQRNLEYSPGYYLSPRHYESLAGDVARSIDELWFDGLVVPGFGRYLRGDYRDDQLIGREETRARIEKALNVLNQGDRVVAVEGGNLPTLRYADHVYEVPHASSQFNIVDESVPFMPLVLRNSLSFSFTPINLALDYREVYLRSVETGADLAFIWTFEESSLFKGTRFDEYYATEFRAWFERAVKLHNEHRTVRRALEGAVIVSHERIKPSVYRSEYDEGQVLIVNYSRFPVAVGDQVIEAQDFVLVHERND